MSAEMICELIATWETPYSSTARQELEQATGKPDAQGADNVIRFGPALPDAEDGRMATLAVRLQTEKEHEKPRALRWHLHLRQPPNNEPPEAIKARDTAIGGRAGLMKLAQGHLPKLPPIVSLQLTLIVPNEYRCIALPDEPVRRDGQHALAASLAQTTRLEQIGYRFEDSPYGLEEVAIIYGHQQDLFKVNVRARTLLRIGSSRWFPVADDVRDIVLNAFFQPRAGS